MRSGRVVALEGPSASGKSAVARALATDGSVEVIAEAYDRLTPPPRLVWRSEAELLRLERRLLGEEARRYVEARRRAGRGSVVLTDTGFLGPLTYTRGLVELGAASPSTLARMIAIARRRAAAGTWGLADGVVFLETPPAVRARRARRDPAGHAVALQERHQRVATIERRLYRQLFSGTSTAHVSGLGPPDRVAYRVQRALDRLAGAPRTRPRVATVLREIGRVP